MKINLSTVFQVLVLIAQDVLALEAKQAAASVPNQTLPSESPGTTDS